MVFARLPFRLSTLVSSTRLTTRPRHALLQSIARSHIVSPSLRRTYATPAKPKKGSIGASAKRGRAATGPKRTTKKAATKPKKAKKPAAKKKRATKKKPSAAAAAKKKAQALKLKEKKEKARAKANTPEEKIKVLKKQALKPPKVTSSSAWVAFWSAKARNDTSLKGSGIDGISNAVKSAAQEFRNLSASQKESYERSGKEAQAKAKRELQAWVNQYSAEEIRQANLARAHLRRLKASKSTSRFAEIKDERKVKRPSTPYLRFATLHNTGSTGDLITKARDAARAWKELDAQQKQRYVDEYEADKAQYAREYQRVYGVPAPSASKKRSPSPA